MLRVINTSLRVVAPAAASSTATIVITHSARIATETRCLGSAGIPYPHDQRRSRRGIRGIEFNPHETGQVGQPLPAVVPGRFFAHRSRAEIGDAEGADPASEDAALASRSYPGREEASGQEQSPLTA